MALLLRAHPEQKRLFCPNLSKADSPSSLALGHKKEHLPPSKEQSRTNSGYPAAPWKARESPQTTELCSFFPVDPTARLVISIQTSPLSFFLLFEYISLCLQGHVHSHFRPYLELSLTELML